MREIKRWIQERIVTRVLLRFKPTTSQLQAFWFKPTTSQLQAFWGPRSHQKQPQRA